MRKLFQSVLIWTQCFCLFFSCSLSLPLLAVYLEFDQYAWNIAHPLSNGVFMAAVLFVVFLDKMSPHQSPLCHIQICELPLWAVLTGTQHTSGFPSSLFSHLSLTVSPFPYTFSHWCCLCLSVSLSLLLWFIGNESGMREYAGGEMGTFREMAVSGQTSSHQDRKWLEGCVRESVSVCFCIIRPAGDQLRAA